MPRIPKNFEVDISNLENRLERDIDGLDIAQALYLYCDWGSEVKEADNFAFGNPRNLDCVRVIDRANAKKSKNGNFTVSMYEDFSSGKSFSGFKGYLKKYVSLSSFERRRLWARVYEGFLERGVI